MGQEHCLILGFLNVRQLHAAAGIAGNVAEHFRSVHGGGNQAVDIVDRFGRLALAHHRLHPVGNDAIVELVHGNVADDRPYMEFQHGLVCLNGSARWPDQQVDVFLDNFRHRRRAFLIRQDGVLSNLERLTVGVQQPL
ncbi:hypothetical protein NG819_16340 [Pseudarthrobacter sp. Fe7]|nr:hypothetical protein NG819_16340 [Pseudarthrobacter sp. Fe7]